MSIKIEKLYLYLNRIAIQEYYPYRLSLPNHLIDLTLFYFVQYMQLEKRKNLRFKQIEFAKLISKHSKTQVIVIRDYKDIEKYLKKT